ncbi:hypothetical protein [Cellulomonas sp. URHB0016]
MSRLDGVTAPDVRQASAIEVMTTMLSKEKYSEKTGIAPRTLDRYLPEGRIEGAVKDSRGAWRIPADARLLPSTAVVRQAEPDVVPPPPDVRLADAIATLPAFVNVVTAARLLGIPADVVRENAVELDGRQWGRRLSDHERAWVIPLATIRRLAGL